MIHFTFGRLTLFDAPGELLEIRRPTHVGDVPPETRFIPTMPAWTVRFERGDYDAALRAADRVKATWAEIDALMRHLFPGGPPDDAK
jgi:hypothetical protein